MIRYTTPTQTIKVKGIDLTGYDVTVSLRQLIGVTQNAHEVDIGGDAVSLALDGSDTAVTFTLTQEQSGGFVRGWVDVQVNYGSGDTRMASSVTSLYMERNLLTQVVEFAVSTDPDTSVPDAEVEAVTETYVPAVTSDMIANGAVTYPKLASGAVTEGKIANYAVTSDKLAEATRNMLNPKGIICLGDSYGQGWTPDGMVNSWINFFKSKVEQYGYTVYSSALGGAGFWRDDSSKRFSTLATNLIATLTDAQKQSIGTVVVGGGYNDRANTRADIYTGMVNLRSVINTNLPNVSRVLVFPFGMGVQGLTTGDHASFTYSTIVDMIKNYVDANAEARLGTIVGNSYMVLRRNTLFSSDYVHPKENGQYEIGCFVSDVFFGNEESIVAKKFNDWYEPNFVGVSGMALTTVKPTVLTNGCMFVVDKTGQMQIEPSPTVNLVCDGAHPIQIGTFKDAAIQQYGHFFIPVSATVRSSTSTPLRYQQIVGEVDVTNGVMMFIAIATTADGTNYLTVESVDRIMMKPLANPAIDGLILV